LIFGSQINFRENSYKENSYKLSARVETAIEIRDKLLAVIDGNDQLFVGFSLGDMISNWLKQNLE